MSFFSFEVLKSCPGTHARRGRMLTPHGPVETPAFMPVGTQATVKTLTPRELREVGAGIILGNTYHLYLRPGMEVIREAGGLHRFMSWDGPILTDSGGFQIFSLQKLRDLREEGAFFRSHIDGSSHLFTPESVVDIQHVLGSDIMMPLDECLPYPSEREYARASLERTHRWAGRALEHHGKSSSGGEQALFGIVQGGMFRDLREESARALVAMDFPGYSIGGLSVGESKEVMHEVLDWTIPLLPGEKPRYLMGVGTPEDFFECISRGVDIFDCVLPTRIARNGTVMTSQGKLVLKNARHRMDFSPLDPECSCSVCRGYSRSYLRHLFIADEILGPRLTTYHNLYFLENLMSNIRLSLEEGRFTEFRDAFMEKYRGDLAPDGGSRPE